MAKIKVIIKEGVGPQNKVIVDGKNISNITTGINIHITPDKILTYLSLVFNEQEIEIENSEIILSSVEIPESIQEKLYEILEKKFKKV